MKDPVQIPLDVYRQHFPTQLLEAVYRLDYYIYDSLILNEVLNEAAFTSKYRQKLGSTQEKWDSYLSEARETGECCIEQIDEGGDSCRTLEVEFLCWRPV